MSDNDSSPPQTEQLEEVPLGEEPSLPLPENPADDNLATLERPSRSAPLEEGTPDAGLDYLYASDEESSPSPQESNAATAVREARIQRRYLGLGLTFGTLLPAIIIGIVAYSYPSLPDWAEVQQSLEGQPDGRLYYLLALLLGKSAFVLANVWLIYQLLRAAERLFIPPEMAKDAQYLLGMKMPQREAPQMLAKQLSEVLTPVKDLLTAILPDKQDKPGSK